MSLRILVLGFSALWVASNPREGINHQRNKIRKYGSMDDVCLREAFTLGKKKTKNFFIPK